MITTSVPAMARLTLLLTALPLIAACGAPPNNANRQPIGAAGQDQACAARLAQQVDRPLHDIRANSRDTAPSGNSVVFVQTADGSVRATCEITDFGDIVGFEVSYR